MIHFYLYQKDNLIVVSDLPKEKIKAKYGPMFEIVNSMKDKEHLDLIKGRLSKSYPRTSFKDDFYQKKVFSEEYREKLRLAKLGKPRSDEARKKISQSRKGKSNFEGKKHKFESRKKTSFAMAGNKNVKDKKWVYNPLADKEKRVDNIFTVEEGYRVGRDPENVNDNLGSGDF